MVIEQDAERNEVHVGDAMFEAGGDEGGDRKNDGAEPIDDAAAGQGEPNSRANKNVAQQSLKERLGRGSAALAAAILTAWIPTAPPFICQ